MNSSLESGGSGDSGQDRFVDELAHEFMREWRDGKDPQIEDFAGRHPELAEEIRELFPAVIFAEQLNLSSKTDVEQTTEGHPEHLGPFWLHREIGQGGMGIVYEATQEPFRQKFAVKVLKPRLIRSETLSIRFAREAEAASRLHHTNIVPARHFGMEGKYNFLVMPMIDGVSLDRLINPLETVDPQLFILFEEICSDWQRFAAFGSQVASALSHAHQHGMIHRDIKPANLLLDRESNVWVTDFGLAKVYDDVSDLSCTGELIGTPRYMAPEQMLGAADERSDIYGLGITLYEMLARETDWRRFTNDDQNECDTVARNEACEIPSSASHDASHGRLQLEIPPLHELNPQVPRQLADLIMKACEYHPEERFQTAREFEVALNEVSYQGKLDRRSSARRYATLGATQARTVALLLGVIVVVGVSIWNYERAELVANTRATPSALSKAGPLANCICFDEPGTDLINVHTRVSARNDDAEEYGKGEVYLDSSDLEMTWDSVDQLIGMRFAGVNVPRGAEIVSATIIFCADQGDHIDTNLRIHGIDDVDPPSFRPLQYDLSQRPRLEEHVDWQPEPWEYDELYETPSVIAIVQELVNRETWKSGNAIGFLVDGSGLRSAVAYDGHVNWGPLLRIQYRSSSSTLTAGI